MKIFIDFDDVIFDTKRFIVDYKQVFQNNGISDEDFGLYVIDYNTRFKKGENVTYNPDDHILSLKNKLNIDLDQLKKDFDEFMSSTKKYIFDDFYNFVEKIGFDNLSLISYGNKDFQSLKIRNSGVEKFFNKIIITDGLKSEAFQKNNNNEDVYFLDDQLRHIEDAKKKIPNVTTFLVEREGGRHLGQDKNECCDFVVKDFGQVYKIII